MITRPEVKEILQDCDAILHAGDIDSQKVLDKLTRLAPTCAVRGNADKEWASHLPKTLLVELFGKKFFLVHNKRDLSPEAGEADFIICGHSHKYDERTVGSQIWLNPGSCGKRRFSLPITMMVMEIADDGSARILRKDLAGEQAVSAPASPEDPAAIVRSVIRETDRGTPVADIAEKCRISPALAEQICRMYTTHPGIDVDGILNRITERS